MLKGYFPDTMIYALFERQTKSIFIGVIFRKFVGSRQKQILKHNIFFNFSFKAIQRSTDKKCQKVN
jgi:hypothetical protein